MPITGDDLIAQLTSGKYLVLGKFIVSLSNIMDKSYIANVIAGADELSGHICETFEQAEALQVNVIDSRGLPETLPYASDEWKVLFDCLVEMIHTERGIERIQQTVEGSGTLDGPMESPGNDNDGNDGAKDGSGGASHVPLRF